MHLLATGQLGWYSAKTLAEADGDGMRAGGYPGTRVDSILPGHVPVPVTGAAWLGHGRAVSPGALPGSCLSRWPAACRWHGFTTEQP